MEMTERRSNFDTPLKVRKVINRWFVYPVFNYLVPSFAIKAILNWSGSPVVKESFKSPGSWRVMNLFYENELGHGFIHYLIMTSALAMGLRNRKRMVVANLTRLFDQHQNNKLTVLGVGTGPAISIMESMVESFSTVKAYCVDLDESAFSYGEELKRKLGLRESVEFIHSDAREAIHQISEVPHIIEIVGLFEYLDDVHVTQLCEFAFNSLSSGGVVMANTVSPNHGVRCFIEKAFGLKLKYRDEATLIDFMEKSGFRIIRVEREPLNVYSLILAKKR